MAVPIPLPVVDVSVETPRTRVVRLALGSRMFPFLAGQAVDLGLSGQRVRKPYSIACSPELAGARRLLEFLIQVGPDGTPGPHLQPLRPGVLVDVGPPLGGFVLPADEVPADLLFVAGGTGIAPLRSMLGHALATRPGVCPGLLYSARAHTEFAFGRELRALADGGRIRLRETITRETEGGWTGSRGRIARAHLESLLGHTGVVCLVCGPSSFAADMRALLVDLGVPVERILTDTWG